MYLNVLVQSVQSPNCSGEDRFNSSGYVRWLAALAVHVIRRWRACGEQQKLGGNQLYNCLIDILNILDHNCHYIIL